MTKAARFSQADVRRALKVAEQTGLSVAGYEIAPDGTIRVLTSKPDEADDWRNGSPLYGKAA